MGLRSFSVLEKEGGGMLMGAWEWPEPAHVSSSQGLTCVHRAQAILFLVLGGVCLMEDMLWLVSQLFMAQKKMPVCFLGLWLIHFFHIMKEILHSCKLARKLNTKAVSQSKPLVTEAKRNEAGVMESFNLR